MFIEHPLYAGHRWPKPGEAVHRPVLGAPGPEADSAWRTPLLGRADLVREDRTGLSEERAEAAGGSGKET